MSEHLDPDELVALALGDVDDRATLERHLAGCPACRQEYDACARAVEEVLALAPKVEPPSGFDTKVLAAITPARPRRRARWLAVAAVVGVLVGGGVGAVAQRVADHPTVSAGASAGTPLRAGGSVVGSVTKTTMDGAPVAVVAVSGASGMHYRCLLLRQDGTSVEAGYWTLTGSKHDTWVVPLDSSVTRLQLVGDSGAVWASARL